MSTDDGENLNCPDSGGNVLLASMVWRKEQGCLRETRGTGDILHIH